jgi:hypothetical protein
MAFLWRQGESRWFSRFKENVMKWLLPVALASAVIAIGTPVQAQSRYDRCSAHARDAMMGFYPSSTVPVPMATRARRAPRGASFADAGAMAGKAHAANQGVGSLQGYFDQCMAR